MGGADTSQPAGSKPSSQWAQLYHIWHGNYPTVMFDKKNRMTIMEPEVKKAYMELTGMDELFYCEAYTEAFYEFRVRALEVVCNYQRRRSQGIPKEQYGGVLDVMVRAPNYLKDARYRKAEQLHGQNHMDS